MKIRFINTTTKLPVNQDIEKIFLKVIRPAYQKAVESDQRQEYIDVIFVNEKDLDLERIRIELGTNGNEINSESIEPDDVQNKIEMSMDVLGVYIAQHPEFNRDIIKVCPEKIMAVCVDFKKNNLETQPLAELYPLLLVAVIIHELAHWLMSSSSKPKNDIIPWKWLANTIDDDSNYDLKKRLSSSNYHHFSHVNHANWRSLEHFIEESLANAFVLKQNLTVPEIGFLNAFIDTQPQGYKHGRLWSGNLNTTLKAARNWQCFKNKINLDKFYFIFEEKKEPTQNLVDSLQAGKYVTSFDFLKSYQKYLIKRVPDWQLKYQNNSSAWNDRLNGVLGIYWKIISCSTFGAPLRLKWLKQWAKNGSFEGTDQLHKTLAAAAIAKGNHKKALGHQCDRLANLPKLKLSDYWHDIHTAELQASILELKSQLGIAKVAE